MRTSQELAVPTIRDINEPLDGVEPVAASALYAGGRSNARHGLGGSDVRPPALDTANQCEMFVVRTWVRILRILFILRIRPGLGMGARADRRGSCALVD